MSVHVRAPASTANLGPGFDCVAVALDLWNEVEVVEGADGPADLGHLGVRAFARIADPEGWTFRWTTRVPRECGLGSSASVIALGLVAAAASEGREPDPEELLEVGARLEGHCDNLAAALAGGVCLTSGGRIARVADGPPAVPVAVVPQETLLTVQARTSLPESVPHREATASLGAATLLGAALASGSARAPRRRPRRRPAPRAVPSRRRLAPRRGSGGAPGRRARRDALGRRPGRRRVGGAGRGGCGGTSRSGIGFRPPTSCP